MPHALVAKYGETRLPRYTSYPTAPAFSDAVGPQDYAEGLAALGPGLGSAPVSLYLHIPFCRDRCWYCGCHTSISRQDAPISEYLEVLTREIALVSRATGGELSVETVHFGGGTPTVVQPEAFVALMTTLRQAFAFQDDAGIAVEIDPRTLTGGMI